MKRLCRTAAKRKPNEFALRRKPNQTPQEANASLVVAGLATNAVAAWEWSAFPFGDVEKRVDLTATLNNIVDAAERVNRGDLGDEEALLTAQTVTLNALFVSLAHSARTTKLMDHLDRYLRLALKAQAQCRATCETLALLKNPPVFTRQANIASQQVVNNGTMVAGSRAGDSSSEPNQLLEAHGERLDGGATRTAGSGDSALATLGTLDRPADGGGQGALLPERLPRRAEAASARTRSIPGAASRRPKARESVTRDGGGRR